MRAMKTFCECEDRDGNASPLPVDERVLKLGTQCSRCGHGVRRSTMREWVALQLARRGDLA